MTRSIKRKIARATACNEGLNKKILCLKCSLDEVNIILNGSKGSKGSNKKKKKKCYK